MRYVNGLAAEAVASFCDTIPTGRPVRVLEVGAGTGATTSALLPVLPPDRSRYWFTDVSDFFFDRARERFAGEATMTFCMLDLDQDLRAQGFAREHRRHRCRQCGACERRCAGRAAPAARPSGAGRRFDPDRSRRPIFHGST